MPENLSLEEIDLLKEMLRGEISKTSETKIDINELRNKLKDEDYSYFFKEIPPLEIDTKKLNQAIDKYSKEIENMFSKLSNYYTFKEEKPELAEIYDNCYENLNKSKLDPVNIDDYPNLKNIFTLIYFDPNEVNSWINQGFIFEKFNRYDQAIKCFENALSLDSSDFTICVYLSEDFEKINEYDKSTSWIKEAIKLSPNNSNLWIKKWEITRNKLRYYKFGIHKSFEDLEFSDLTALAKMAGNFLFSTIIYPINILSKQEILLEEEIIRCRKCGMKYRNMPGLIHGLCPICTSIKIQENKLSFENSKRQKHQIVINNI